MKVTVVLQFDCSGDKKALRHSLKEYDGGVETTFANELGSGTYRLKRVLKVTLPRRSKRHAKFAGNLT